MIDTNIKYKSKIKCVKHLRKRCACSEIIIDPRFTESEGVVRAIQKRKDRLEETSRSRCYECQRFLSDKTKIATIREPEVFYCPRCYSNGLEEEKIAMGYYEKSYSTN